MPSSALGAGVIPGWKAEIPHASWPKTKNKDKQKSRTYAQQKQYCKKFNKDFKTVSFTKAKYKSSISDENLVAKLKCTVDIKKTH